MKIVAGINSEMDIETCTAFVKASANVHEVIGVTVVPRRGLFSSLLRHRPTGELDKEIAKIDEVESGYASSLLNKFKTGLESQRIKVDTHVTRGDPASELINSAAKSDADLLLITRGQRDYGKTANLGPVANRVVRRAPCSVMLIDPANPVPRKLLYATDGSPQAGNAGEQIRSLGIKGSPIVVICTVPAVTSPAYIRLGGAGYNEYQQAVSRLREHETALARQLLVEAGSEFEQPHFRVRTMQRTGDPVEVLLKVIIEEEIDLLALGAKGISALSGFFLGSITLKMLGITPCSMLIAR